MASKLENLIARIETWPEAARQELLDVAHEIESELGSGYRATRAQLEGIDRGLRAAEAGEMAPADEVELVFGAFCGR